jgi:DNA invertase Pin-like site-specific DNA recombinase
VGIGEPVIGYLRVSTQEQADSGLGLESQRAAIEAECTRRGWTLETVYQDAGASGKSLKGRPGLAEGLEQLRTGLATGIIVAKLDRLSRSLLDFARLMATAQKEGWNLVALDLGIDLSTPAGEFMAGVMASAAQWERRIISQRTKDALAVKKSQGARLGTPPAITSRVGGYIERRRRRGATLQAICDGLNKTGVPTPRGGQIWRPSSLQAFTRGI